MIRSDVLSRALPLLAAVILSVGCSRQLEWLDTSGYQALIEISAIAGQIEATGHTLGDPLRLEFKTGEGRSVYLLAYQRSLMDLELAPGPLTLLAPDAYGTPLPTPDSIHRLDVDALALCPVAPVAPGEAGGSQGAARHPLRRLRCQQETACARHARGAPVRPGRAGPRALRQRSRTALLDRLRRSFDALHRAVDRGSGDRSLATQPPARSSPRSSHRSNSGANPQSTMRGRSRSATR
jgi:hypothetical protein